MWSVGCIFAELLQMKRKNVVLPDGVEEDSQYVMRSPLFPGKSCFPLTAKDPFDYESRNDQLNVIFEVLGTPTEKDIGKIRDKKAAAYLASLKKIEPIDLKTKFPGEDDKSLDLLRKLLAFDVDERITVDDALEHPYLRKVRDKNAEKRHDPTTFEFEDVPLSIDILRAMIIDEICLYNPKWKQDMEHKIESQEAQAEQIAEQNDA
jgi:mitogen-activated protein kinase 1/3